MLTYVFICSLRIKSSLLTFRKYMDEIYENNCCVIQIEENTFFYETIEMSNKRFYYSFIFCITLHLFLHCLKAHYLQVRINISWPFFVLENCPLSLAINLTGAEGIYRKVVIVISVILSRPFGYGSMLLAERACFELGSHSP